MKAIAINGSPRNGGNTGILPRNVLEPLTEAGWTTEFIQLGASQSLGAALATNASRRKIPTAGKKMTSLTHA